MTPLTMPPLKSEVRGWLLVRASPRRQFEIRVVDAEGASLIAYGPVLLQEGEVFKFGPVAVEVTLSSG